MTVAQSAGILCAHIGPLDSNLEPGGLADLAGR